MSATLMQLPLLTCSMLLFMVLLNHCGDLSDEIEQECRRVETNVGSKDEESQLRERLPGRDPDLLDRLRSRKEDDAEHAPRKSPEKDGKHECRQDEHHPAALGDHCLEDKKFAEEET